MLTQIINGRIFTPQGWLNEGSVLMRDGKILEVTNCAGYMCKKFIWPEASVPLFGEAGFQLYRLVAVYIRCLLYTSRCV